MEDIKAASLQILGTMTRLQVKAPAVTKDAWNHIMSLTEQIEKSAKELQKENMALKETNKKVQVTNAALAKQNYTLRQELKTVKSNLDDSQKNYNAILGELKEVMNNTDIPNSPPNAHSTPRKTEDPGTSDANETE